MMQTKVFGKDAAEFLESLTTCDLQKLSPGRGTLTVFTNEDGGILDDLIVTKVKDDEYFVVSNAGRRDEDSNLLLEQRVQKANLKNKENPNKNQAQKFATKIKK